MSNTKPGIEDLQKHLYEYNKNGFTPVHEASFNGYINAVKRYITNAYNKASLLEIVTKDDQAMTPILLAALGSNLEIVKFLYESGANLHAKNSSGHSIVEIVIMRQDFKMLSYLIDLYNRKERELEVWPKLIRLFTSKINEVSASAGRCLECLTSINCYDTQDLNETAWLKNCLALIENNLYKSLSKVLMESSRDTILSGFIILLNMMDYGSYTKKSENLKQFLQEDGYQCLISLVGKIEKMDNDLIILMSKLLKKMSDSRDECEYFSNKDFNDLPKQLFDCLVRGLEKISNQLILNAYTYFISNLLEFNPKMEIDLHNLKHLTKIILKYLKKYESDENFAASLIRLTSLLANRSNEIQTLLIELDLSNLLIGLLKSDSENIRSISMNCIIQSCKSNVSVQKAFYNKKIDDILLHFLSRYLERNTKTLAMTAVWSIAGDDLLQRNAVCKKINLELLNECISDQEDDLYVIACSALIVMFEQPPSVAYCAHDNFFKIDMVAIKLVRILSNEIAVNVLAALRCIKKICSTCGENGYRQAQKELKNGEVIPYLITLVVHAKQSLVRAEAANALAYVCLENKENTKLTFETLDFSFIEVFNLLKVSSIHIKLLCTKALAIFAFNNLEQEANIGYLGLFSFSLFKEYLNLPTEADKCEGAYQIILLSQLIYNQEHTKLIALGIRILISYIEKESIEITIKSMVLEMFAGLSKLKNGVAEALLAINLHDILCDTFLIRDKNLEGYIAIILANLCNYPDGRRKLLAKCRRNPKLYKILDMYSNYPESRYKLPEIFIREWEHLNSLIQ